MLQQPDAAPPFSPTPVPQAAEVDPCIGYNLEATDWGRASLSVVVLGASGDLAKKKIFPALFALYYEGLLPQVRGTRRDQASTKALLGTLACFWCRRALNIVKTQHQRSALCSGHRECCLGAGTVAVVTVSTCVPQHWHRATCVLASVLASHHQLMSILSTSVHQSYQKAVCVYTSTCHLHVHTCHSHPAGLPSVWLCAQQDD
jgi:hypothetical protein